MPEPKIGGDQNPFARSIDRLLSSEQMFEKRIGRSLDEIYRSGAYGMAVEPPFRPDQPRFPYAFRLLVLTEDKIVSHCIQWGSKASERLDTVDAVLGRLQMATEWTPYGPPSIGQDHGRALEALNSRGLQTVAAVALNQEPVGHRFYTEIVYPKVYGKTLGPSPQLSRLPGGAVLLEPTSRDFGERDRSLEVSVDFLRSTPLGTGTGIIMDLDLGE